MSTNPQESTAEAALNQATRPVVVDDDAALQEPKAKKAKTKETSTQNLAQPAHTGARPSRLKNDGTQWVDAYMEYAKGERVVVQNEEEQEEGEAQSWESVDWDTVRESVAREMLEQEALKETDPSLREQTIQKSSKSWNIFYAHNKQNFFKNRSYLWREFPELNPENKAPWASFTGSGKPTILEVGCGVGNSIWPLVDLHPDKFFIGFDCSANAVKLVQSHEKYDDKNTCKAFVCDVSEQDIPAEEVPDASVDIVMMIFVLSAIPPEKHEAVLTRLKRVLKPGGVILFRDYGLYDLTQMRFFAKKTSKLSENLYKRGDGTMTYFFSKEYTDELFKKVGFNTQEMRYDTRMIKNRKRKIKMYRVWLQARFSVSPSTQQSNQ